MSFLSPWMIAAAAGLTVPPLLLLYFLKLRRQEMPISSTFLWKRAVEDLHVNAPFQRLRSNLLLILQLLILLLAAIALGKPMLEQALSHESTLVLMIDQSASMTVAEANGLTRLEIAKREAKKLIDGMSDDARAMIIAFCDRATVVSSFDTNREALKRKVDSIEQTQSKSTLSEAIALAEAYSQNLIIGGQTTGSDIAPTSAAPAASAIIFTDGRVEDAANVSLERIRSDNVEVVTVGKRDDNVGIIAMDARRNYEQPDLLEVFATVQNFGPEPVRCDAVLRVRDEDGIASQIDVQELSLAPGRLSSEDAPPESGADENAESKEASSSGSKRQAAPPGSVAAVAFDEFAYTGGGIIEVSLTVDDALVADNRAWTVINPPRHVDVLLVTAGNLYLEKVFTGLPVSTKIISPAEYETLDDEALIEDGRSKFDVVILDRYSTDRLPQGNYFFWGSVPKIEGVSMGPRTEDVFIVNWDETHPILRHVNVETIQVYEEFPMQLPSDADVLLEGETSPVLSLLSRDGNDYLICSFPLIMEDAESGEPMANTWWFAKIHFPVFVFNAVQYMSASVAPGAKSSIPPGEPVQVPVANRRKSLNIVRPDGTVDEVPTGGATSTHYARTRLVGVYEARGATAGQDRFSVNLFNQNESDISPAASFSIGASKVASGSRLTSVNRPFWQWVLLGILGVLLFEWIVYNKRVFV